MLERKDRMSMAVGLEVRVPFCDHRLVEYVWNLPWALKSVAGESKSLLRQALRGHLPQAILERRKSGFPANPDPRYLTLLRERVGRLLADATARRCSNWWTPGGSARLSNRARRCPARVLRRARPPAWPTC